jgi:hypothetical protein
MRIVMVVSLFTLTGCTALQSSLNEQRSGQTERRVVVCDRDSVRGHCSRMSEEQYQALLRNMTRPSTGSHIAW